MKHPFKQVRQLPEFIEGEYNQLSEEAFDVLHDKVSKGVVERNKAHTPRETYEYFKNRFNKFR